MGGLRMMLRVGALSVVLLCSLRAAMAQPYDNVGGAIADLPGAALWHFKVFVALPDNFRRFTADVEVERGKLEPGEEKRFEIIFRSGPDGQPLRYSGLAPAGEPRIVSSGTTSVAEIKIQKPSLVWLPPLLLLSREDFEKICDATADQPATRELEYEDWVFTTNASNRLSGFDFDYQVDEHAIAVAPRSRWVNLLEPRALATADGRVILVSIDGEAEYKVFNLATNQTESYKKGPAVIERGTMVYVLSNFAGRRYVTAYRHMHSAAVKPGDSVMAGQQVGMLWPEPVDVTRMCAMPKPDTDPEVVVYRVNREDQHYLSNLQEKPKARLLFSR